MPSVDAPDLAEPLPAAINIFGEFRGAVPAAGHGKPVAASDVAIQQHTASDEGYDADVTLDPVGKWLAFVSTRHSPNAHLYLQKVDGLSVVQLTEGAGDEAHPSFSPDAKRIAFASSRSGNWDLYLTDLDGRTVTQVTTSNNHEMHPSFSPDGNRLVYCSLGVRSDQWELWTIDLRTQEKRMIGNGLFPSWSPAKDVDRIAFQRARQRGSRWFSAWTLDLRDGEPRRLTEVAVSPVAAIVTPRWSPDGAKLTFATVVEPARAAGDKSRAPQDLWVINADGTGRRRVTDGTGSNFAPHWGVDNRIYFVSTRAGTENVWSVRAEEPAAITTAAVETHATSVAAAATPRRPMPASRDEPTEKTQAAAPAAHGPTPAAAPAAPGAPAGHGTTPTAGTDAHDATR